MRGLVLISNNFNTNLQNDNGLVITPKTKCK